MIIHTTYTYLSIIIINYETHIIIYPFWAMDQYLLVWL